MVTCKSSATTVGLPSHLQPSLLHGVPNGVVIGHEPVLELQARLPAGHRTVPAMDEDV